ncbi:MAG: ATP-dependent helicase HrpB [Nocardioides sp.]|uniref:ATP-dependent helicase HrpB n=1 Tax=Nocardioides sp. TaxID=35761 RepID=UPI003EFE7EBC
MSDRFDLDRIGAGLPVAEALADLVQALALPGSAAVVEAPPGSGKTTLVPPALANLVPGRVVVTQPRRVAVRAAARRLAQLDGSAPGDRVGWSVRGERVVSRATVVEFVTPGLLVRRLLADPDLPGVSAVLLDEVHERQLDTDLLVGLLGEVRQLRDDLTLVAMSATLDAGRFADLLGDASTPVPRISAPWALHPLEVEWAPYAAGRTDERGVRREFLDHVADRTARAYRAALAEEPSADALVFVPGAREVAHVASALRDELPDVDVLELHGGADAAEQDRAVAGRTPADGQRVVVSTALAESSLTVPGVRLVVDAGLSREPRRDAARGMSGLVTVTASRDACVQRAGRAARTGPGRVVRCYDERTFTAAPAHVTPEVLTADLTGLTLQLAAWGTPRGAGLRLPDPPPSSALDSAESTLRALGALDARGAITASGRRLASMPVDPRWGHALEEAADVHGATAAARAVAAASGQVRHRGADLAATLRDLEGGRHPYASTWRREASRLERLVARDGAATDAAPGGAAGALGAVVAAAWPERLARRVADRTYLLAQGTRAALPSDSPLIGAAWVAVADVARAPGREADGTGAVVRAAVALDEEAALDLAGDLRKLQDVVELDTGRMRARRVDRVGAIELSATPVRLDAASATPAVADALARNGLGLLHFEEAADGLRRRLAFLHVHLGSPWPAVDDESLLARWEEWLAPEVRQIAEGVPLDRVRLLDAVRRLLPWPAASQLDDLAPERLRVPSGGSAAVEYPEVGHDGPPVVRVKLQECFGLSQSPTVAGVPVLFHLLSPARRPLAVTDDLASFWAGPYAQVRAEMRGRYPKHPWPQDPATAQATALTNRRLDRG